jgi:hypothetical protein
MLAAACVLTMVMLAATACGGKAGASNTVASKAASPSVSSTATKAAVTTTKASAGSPGKTTPSATPKAMPKLTDIAFTLTLADGQNYTENTIPVYLKSDQTIHLNWLVVKGGDHFHMTFSLPDGNLIAVGNSGNLTAYGRG